MNINKKIANSISILLMDAINDSADVIGVVKGLREIDLNALKKFLNNSAFEYESEKEEVLAALLLTNFAVKIKRKGDEYWLCAGKYVVVSNLDTLEEAKSFCRSNGLTLEK